MLEARVLGQLLLMQSMVVGLPDEKTIFAFVCRGFLDIPGVAAVRHAENTLEQADASTVRIPLLVGETRRGELWFTVRDPEVFAPYLDHLNNFCFMLAVILGERSQRRQHDLFQSQLENRVQERTEQLLGLIAERRSIEESLRESAERYRDLFNNAEVAMFRTRLDGSEVLDVNRKFLELVGKTREETVGKPSATLWIDPAEREKMVRRLVADGSVTDLEFQMLNEKLGVRDCVTSLRLYPDQGILIGSILDVTDKKRLAGEKARLEDQLRQAQKVEAIGRLAGGVAHDFNNMTAIVLGYGELLLGRLGPEDPARTWAEQILEAGRRSASLTRQLLAFSRKQVLLPVVLDLNVLLRNLESMLGRLIGENIVLRFDLAGDLGRVTVDPGQIEQVVLNLAINARDAMPQGGNLMIETANVELDETYAKVHAETVPGDYVMLALTDTGCGMDKVHLARLFEPFFTTKEMGKGTGLGLATSYGIVKQSGGYIWAYSEPGRGTTFKIYLPRTDVQPSASAVDAGEEAPRGRGERILLVEDEASLREMWTIILSRLGYRVSVAGSGPGALALIMETGPRPDLVITDVIMPCMSGAEMVQRFRKNWPDLKALFMSGYPDEAITSHGVLCPGISFIQSNYSGGHSMPLPV